MCRIRLNDQVMFSCNEAPDFVGLRAKDPSLQGLVHKLGVINKGQGVELYHAVLKFVYT